MCFLHTTFKLFLQQFLVSMCPKTQNSWTELVGSHGMDMEQRTRNPPVCHSMQPLKDSTDLRSILTFFRVWTAHFGLQYEVNMTYDRISGTPVLFSVQWKENFVPRYILFWFVAVPWNSWRQVKKSTELILLIYLWQDVGQSVQSQAPLLGQLTAREEKKLLQRVACQLDPRKREKQEEACYPIRQ